MITESQIYWITRCDAIESALTVTAIFLGIGYFALLMATVFHCIFKNDKSFTEEDKQRYRTLKRLLAITALPYLLLLSGALLMPTTKEMCAIKIIPMVANNDDVQEIPANVADLANEWIEELRPQKEQ